MGAMVLPPRLERGSPGSRPGMLPLHHRRMMVASARFERAFSGSEPEVLPVRRQGNEFGTLERTLTPTTTFEASRAVVTLRGHAHGVPGGNRTLTCCLKGSRPSTRRREQHFGGHGRNRTCVRSVSESNSTTRLRARFVTGRLWPPGILSLKRGWSSARVLALVFPGGVEPPFRP